MLSSDITKPSKLLYEGRNYNHSCVQPYIYIHSYFNIPSNGHTLLYFSGSGQTISLFCVIPPPMAFSLVPTLRAPPGEKRSGERSRIFWAYSPKRWKTNEIARSLIIT